MMLMKTIYSFTDVQNRLKLSKALLTTATVLSLAAVTCPAAETEAGFTNLFDGKTLAGWMRLDNRGADYYVTNGVIVCPENSGGDLMTKGEYSDFVFRMEFKLDADGNNGVGIRVPTSTNNLTYVGV